MFGLLSTPLLSTLFSERCCLRKCGSVVTFGETTWGEDSQPFGESRHIFVHTFGCLLIRRVYSDFLPTPRVSTLFLESCYFGKVEGVVTFGQSIWVRGPENIVYSFDNSENDWTWECASDSLPSPRLSTPFQKLLYLEGWERSDIQIIYPNLRSGESLYNNSERLLDGRFALKTSILRYIRHSFSKWMNWVGSETWFG